MTAEPPETVTVLVGVPAVAVPGERVVVVVFDMTPSSPTVITVFTVFTVVTVRTVEPSGIAVFGGAATATRYPTRPTPATPPAAATAVILGRWWGSHVVSLGDWWRTDPSFAPVAGANL